MHELSLAEALLDTALHECKKSGYQKIDSITLKIGRASGVAPDALKFSFDILKKDTPAETAVLNIITVKVSAICKNCKCSFYTEEAYILECPHCHTTSFDMLGGRELEIAEMEVS